MRYLTRLLKGTTMAVAEAITKPLIVKTLVSMILTGSCVFGFLATPARAQSFASALREAIAQSWYELSPQERSRALENYRRFQKLPPEKQHSIEEQYNRWQQLPSEGEERIRRNYARYRGITPKKKKKSPRKYGRWRSLPPSPPRGGFPPPPLFPSTLFLQHAFFPAARCFVIRVRL